MTPKSKDPAEDPDLRLKRLRLRSWRRGMKEMDLILGRFADTALSDLPPEGLDLYETLLAENDQDLYEWVSGRTPPPDRFRPLVGEIATSVADAGPSLRSR